MGRVEHNDYTELARPIFEIKTTDNAMDKTFAEIRDAFMVGLTCIVDGKAMITAVDVRLMFVYTGDTTIYSCEAFDEYPQRTGAPE